MTEAFAIGLGLLLGSIPFSVLVARVVLGVDPRDYGDGNPGASNVGRAGGRAIGALAAVLDVAKGAFPVGLAIGAWGIAGPALAATIVAPVAAHVWSPWLGGRGGKGTATAYGVLIPVTLPLGPVAMPALLVGFYRLVAPDGWAPVLGIAVVGLVLVATGARSEIVAAVVAIGAIVAWRYRADLVTGIRLRRRAGRTAGIR